MKVTKTHFADFLKSVNGSVNGITCARDNFERETIEVEAYGGYRNMTVDAYIDHVISMIYYCGMSPSKYEAIGILVSYKRHCTL